MTIPAKFLAILAAIGASGLCGCTTESLQRMAYGAVQNTEQEQCMNNTAAAQSIHCIRNVPYDEYQRKRAEVNSNR